jgi:pimeloyl-ACP methyl ester carboxylesterase
MTHRGPYTYASRRLAAALTPISHLQRAPYCGPIERLSIRAADGVEVAATLLPRGRPDLLVICHGFASCQRSVAIVWLAEALAGTWDVLTFDWRGYGLSGGNASFGGDEALDLAAVIEAARARSYRCVGVIGESMGGLISLATLGAARGTPLRADAIATLGAPADYALTGGLRPHLFRHVAPRRWASHLSPLLGFRLGGLNPARPLDVVGDIDAPLLLIHGDADAVVPLRNAELLAERAPQARLRVYRGVGHGVIAMRAQAPQALLDDLRAHFSTLYSRGQGSGAGDLASDKVTK